MCFWPLLKELLNFQESLPVILVFSFEREKSTKKLFVEVRMTISAVDANS